MKPPIENIELIREAKMLSRDTVAKKLGINVSNYGKIERGEVSLTIERLYKLADIFKMLPEDILNYHKHSKGNITYIPMEIQADFLAGNIKENIREYKNFSIPIVQTKRGYMIDATGDSMFPVIIQGDYIIVEPIEDIKNVKFGSIYIVVTNDGFVIKRIQSNQSKKHFTLKSDNIIYEPYEIDKKNIISLWLVTDYKLTSLNSINKYLLPENKRQKNDKKKVAVFK